jgi:hypothetical protein
LQTVVAKSLAERGFGLFPAGNAVDLPGEIHRNFLANQIVHRNFVLTNRQKVFYRRCQFGAHFKDVAFELHNFII